MCTLQDRVVLAIHERFQTLPAKSKPRQCTTDIHEWVPLSGIAIIDENESITCLALASGMKCLPASKASLFDSGTVLHDWHAEILAIRAFNHFLLQECYQLASCADYESPVLQWSTLRGKLAVQDSPPFNIRKGLRIMMYCSEAPCGDASMELIMEAQDDPTPWAVAVPVEGVTSGLLGRGSFSQIGIVRRKPCKQGRPQYLIHY